MGLVPFVAAMVLSVVVDKFWQLDVLVVRQYSNLLVADTLISSVTLVCQVPEDVFSSDVLCSHDCD